MTSISWPIILSGDYSDGSICNAADYKNDFFKLRDAVNQLYERFGSYRLSASIKRPMGFLDQADDSHALEEIVLPYMSIPDTISLDVSIAMEGSTGGAGSAMAARRTVKTLIQIPPWMQGVRIRGLQASNTSQFPYSTAGDGVDFKYRFQPPEFGVSVGADIEDFDWRDAYTQFNDGDGAVDVLSINFGGSHVSAGVLDNSTLVDGGAGQSYTAKNEIAGPNYSVFSGTREWRPVMKAKSTDYVVEPGSFIGLWACGHVQIINEIGSVLEGPCVIEYSWDVLLDAMIPIP